MIVVVIHFIFVYLFLLYSFYWLLKKNFLDDMIFDSNINVNIGKWTCRYPESADTKNSLISTNNVCGTNIMCISNCKSFDTTGYIHIYLKKYRLYIMSKTLLFVSGNVNILLFQTETVFISNFRTS